MSRAAANPPPGAGEASPAGELGLPGYLNRSARPLTSLVFVLPFIVIYELGTRLFLTDPVQGTQHIVAFTMMQRFFALFGATGRHLPALAIVAILLSWHIARKDRWAISLPTLLGMAVEGIALGFPLIAFGLLLARLFPAMSTGTGETAAETVILSLGAG